MKLTFTSLFIVSVFVSLAQEPASSLSPRRIWVSANQGDITKGLLVAASDSTLNIFQGKHGDWNKQSGAQVLTLFYSDINGIKIKRKGGLIKGLGIGAGICLLPVIIGSIFGKSTGEGGAYVSLVAVPVGIITGAIIGSTSKKTFFIGGDRSRFQLFRKRIDH